MKTKSCFLFLLLFASKSFCQKNLKNFYYQIGDKKEVKIYKYIDRNNPEYIFYWEVILNPEDHSITTNSYDSDLVKGDSFYETLNRRGTALREYSVFEKNMFGFLRERKAKVSDDKVYQWDIKKKKPYQYKVIYTDKFGETSLRKSRVFEGIDTIQIKDATHVVAKFRDDYQFKLLDGDDSYGFTQMSYYAEGIGMIKYRRYIPDAIMDIELETVLTRDEFEKLKKDKK